MSFVLFLFIQELEDSSASSTDSETEKMKGNATAGENASSAPSGGSEAMMYTPWAPQPYLRRAWSPDRTCPQVQMRQRSSVTQAERQRRTLSAPVPCPEDICNDAPSSKVCLHIASLLSIVLAPHPHPHLDTYPYE